MDERQARLSQAKGDYKTALRNLETISDEIHERRRNSTVGPRERGVGAEGDGVCGDDIARFKMETDEISSEFGTLVLPMGQSEVQALVCRNTDEAAGTRRAALWVALALTSEKTSVAMVTTPPSLKQTLLQLFLDVCVTPVATLVVGNTNVSETQVLMAEVAVEESVFLNRVFTAPQ